MVFNNIQYGNTLHNIIVETIIGRQHHSVIIINNICMITQTMTVVNRVTVIKTTIPEIHSHTTEEAHQAEAGNPTEEL